MSEVLSNLASTVVGPDGYTPGSGVLQVANTAGDNADWPFPGTATFRVTIWDATATPPAPKMIFKVTSITDATHFAGTVTEGPDVVGNPGDFVAISMTVEGLTALFGGGGGGGGPWGSLYTLTAPPLVADLTWINQGGASAADTAQGLFLSAPGSGGDSLRCLVESVPGTPWTVTMAFLANFVPQDYMSSGIVLVESGTGKLINFGFGYDSQPLVRVVYWDDVNSPDSIPTSVPIPPGPLLFFRVTDDGVHLTFSVSSDGLDFTVVYLQTNRNAFFTTGPDQVGIMADSNNGHPVTLTAVSWEGP